jgi:NAD(P)-dependent dehydrogenase (short-subunit alcohol dehydrogenase family)
MTGSLAGKTALITGASRGIGRATALKLASEGALVAVHYGASAEAAEQVLSAIEKAGGKGFLLQGDVTRISDIEAMFAALDKELASRGIDRLDILVNNAGVGVQGSVEDTTEADFDRVFATNVKGLLFVTQHAVPRLRDGGRIINLSSMVGHHAYPTTMAYAATKAAVDSMTLSMAQGLGARGITVNAVAPGATDTDFIAFVMDNEPIISGLKAMTALGEIGRAEDIASVIAFLASDAARWITGERVRASGGMQL